MGELEVFLDVRDRGRAGTDAGESLSRIARDETHQEKGDRHQDGVENEFPMNLTGFQKKKRREDQPHGKIGQMKRLRHGDALAQATLDHEGAERVERSSGEGKQQIPGHDGATIRDASSKESKS